MLMSEEEGTCSVETIEALKKKYGRYFLVFSNQTEDSAELENVVTEEVQDRSPIIRASTDDLACVDLAKQLGTTKVPTVFFVSEQATEKLVEPGVSYDEARKIIRAKVPAPESHPAPT